MDRALAAITSSLLYVLDVAVSQTQHARRHYRCWRAGHWMRPMSDGPVCERCGTFWFWRD